MVNPNISEIITTTIQNRQREVADNVTNNNGLLTRMKTRGNIIETGGGDTIYKPLTYAENGNFQYYSGYEVLDISPTDMITSANYDWKQAASNVSISGLEMRQNAGSERIINLMETRINNTMATISNNISTGIYSDGTASGGKQVGGLQLLVADDPTTGTVGGIDRATYTFWRNVASDVSGTPASASNIRGYMNTVFNQLVRGNDVPDLIVADNNYFGFYQDSLQTQQRFTTDGDLGAAGFSSLKYNNSDVILENGSGIASNHMYFLNTKYLFLEVHPDANMTPKSEKVSVNQDAVVVPVLWMGNMTMSNASLQGVLFE